VTFCSVLFVTFCSVLFVTLSRQWHLFVQYFCRHPSIHKSTLTIVFLGSRHPLRERRRFNHSDEERCGGLITLMVWGYITVITIVTVIILDVKSVFSRMVTS
jgi:hypothetical protein